MMLAFLVMASHTEFLTSPGADGVSEPLKPLPKPHQEHCTPPEAVIPFNSNSPTGSTFTASSTAISTRADQICRALPRRRAEKRR